MLSAARFSFLGLLLLPHGCVLMPHNSIAQLGEPHWEVSAAIFESHHQFIPAHFEVGVDFKGNQSPVLSVLHQFTSNNDHIREEEDTNRKVFGQTPCWTPCQDQPGQKWIKVVIKMKQNKSAKRNLSGFGFLASQLNMPRMFSTKVTDNLFFFISSLSSINSSRVLGWNVATWFSFPTRSNVFWRW